MMRIRVGLALLSCLVLAATTAATASAAPRSVVPVAGNWEGSGPHGVPLSFALIRRGGHLRLTSLAAGSPATCPAVARDAEAVPLTKVSYAGPGGATSVGSPVLPSVALSGQLPGSRHRVYVRGNFSSPRSGTFSVQIQKKLRCGWPNTTLTWSIHPARRQTVADGTWTGPLTAAGLINGNVRLVIGEQGRVVDSFTSFFTCLTDNQQGNTTFRAVPAFEFIRPDGSFYSPLTGTRLHGHNTTWAGRFSLTGKLKGQVRIFDDCTNQVIKAVFSATRARP